ncbi:MAG: hypothetical protein ISS55_07140 [Dehalococcoidales bacterium]|nr:hypothetical protein [Dehalococcoidales bacterium]
MSESNNDIITNMRISLEKAHVKGTPEYIKNLQANSSSPNFKDFRLEGTAALMFAKVGCCVTIRKRAEPPDLALRFNNGQFYAEVKHFREKEQDRIDAAKMSGLDDESELEPYGDTVLLQGKSAWEQVYCVAKDKINQYKEHAPNILVIESSSTSIEDTEIPTAINMIDEDVRSGDSPGLTKLNGILLALDWSNISRQWREVFFYPTSKPAVSLSRELSGLLDEIRQG